jgi:hypothetical protein
LAASSQEVDLGTDWHGRDGLLWASHLEAGQLSAFCQDQMVPKTVAYSFLRNHFVGEWVRKALVSIHDFMPDRAIDREDVRP